MMDTKLSILFYSKTSKQTKDGLTPIYLRITINGERFEQSTQRYVSLKAWSKEAGRAKGNSEEARTINHFLDSLRQKVYDYQREIILDNEHLTIYTFKKRWLGIAERTHSLLEVFKEHNEPLFALIGKDCSKATYCKYRTTYDHTAAFIQWKYGVKDTEIAKLNYSFITDY